MRAQGVSIPVETRALQLPPGSSPPILSPEHRPARQTMAFETENTGKPKKTRRVRQARSTDSKIAREYARQNAYQA
eukprot:436272-Rhodomonas_salina.2